MTSIELGLEVINFQHNDYQIILKLTFACGRSYEKKKIALYYQIDPGVFKMDMACCCYDPQRNDLVEYAKKQKRKGIQVTPPPIFASLVIMS